MNKEEIMKLYHGWGKDQIKAISKYVDKFKEPWPVYGSRDIKFINYCIDNDISVDDVDPSDPIYRKYNQNNVFY